MKELITYYQRKGILYTIIREMNIDNKYIMETVQIGKGSFSDVFKGSIISTGEVVAIKRVSLKNLEKTGEQKTTEEELTIEINIMRSLNHPYIVKYYDVIKTTDYWYIVMEYCDNGTLADVINYNKQNLQTEREATTVYYMAQLKDAIQYIKSKGIMHRDIKPMNVLLSKPNKMALSDTDMGLLFMIDSDKNKEAWDKSQQLVVKVADFGLARYYKEDDQILANTICGSPLYMAPETLVNEKYNSRIDLWAYGVILYEMLFGVYPLSAKNMPQLKMQLKQKKIDFHLDQKFTPECFDLLTKLLEKNHESRINWDNFFKHQWFTLWNNPMPKSIVVTQPKRTGTVPRTCSRSITTSRTNIPRTHSGEYMRQKLIQPQGTSIGSSNSSSSDTLSKRDSCQIPKKTNNLSKINPLYQRSDSRSSSYSPGHSVSPPNSVGSPYNQFRYSRQTSSSREIDLLHSEQNSPTNCVLFNSKAQIIDDYMNDAREAADNSQRYIEYSKKIHTESNPIVIPKPKTYAQTAMSYISGFLG
uniref:Protein kinase domain-containing protein n=1 Tax=viral metagenome TaxID=1070528 RepID=A0A6C0CAX8_9ZZZZ